MQSASPNIQTARIICGALMGGVVLFWGVAFAVAGGGGLGAEMPLNATVLLAIVLVVALGAFGAALAFRSKAVASASVSDPAARDPQAAAASNPLTNLIIAWALLEGQALMAGVAYLLTGNANLLLIPALVFVIGFAMCFPRSEWFEQPSHTAEPQ